MFIGSQHLGCRVSTVPTAPTKRRLESRFCNIKKCKRHCIYDTAFPRPSLLIVCCYLIAFPRPSCSSCVATSASKSHIIIQFGLDFRLLRATGSGLRAPGSGLRATDLACTIRPKDYKSKWLASNIWIRDVFLLSDPSTFGAVGPNGPNQNTSRIQHKEV